MTRINVVPVEELSNQWLIAEYRELPRCIKQNINIDNAPKFYTLGSGHMKWARSHTIYLLKRFFELCGEMRYRGFKVNHNPYRLLLRALWSVPLICWKDYKPCKADIVYNRNRLRERYNSKHKWTCRQKPFWIF